MPTLITWEPGDAHNATITIENAERLLVGEARDEDGAWWLYLDGERRGGPCATIELLRADVRDSVRHLLEETHV